PKRRDESRRGRQECPRHATPTSGAITTSRDRSARVLLLTGATGLVGSELLPRLLASRPDRRIILLTRQPEKLLGGNLPPGVSVLEGDIRDPRLGLDDSQRAELEQCLTEIIHGAAETRFNLPLEEARATNVAGTANLLRLARCSSRLEKFAFLS